MVGTSYYSHKLVAKHGGQWMQVHETMFPGLRCEIPERKRCGTVQTRNDHTFDCKFIVPTRIVMNALRPKRKIVIASD
jgi:hypothetical protein